MHAQCSRKHMSAITRCTLFCHFGIFVIDSNVAQLPTQFFSHPSPFFAPPLFPSVRSGMQHVFLVLCALVPFFRLSCSHTPAVGMNNPLLTCSYRSTSYSRCFILRIGQMLYFFFTLPTTISLYEYLIVKHTLPYHFYEVFRQVSLGPNRPSLMHNALSLLLHARNPPVTSPLRLLVYFLCELDDDLQLKLLSLARLCTTSVVKAE